MMAQARASFSAAAASARAGSSGRGHVSRPSIAPLYARTWTTTDSAGAAVKAWHAAGFNVYPAEIERVLCGHPAAVGGIPDEAKGELAKAYVVLKPGVEATREELVAHCREHLAAYKVPRAVQFTDQVPMTSSGKMMRRLLTEIDDGAR